MPRFPHLLVALVVAVVACTPDAETPDTATSMAASPETTTTLAEVRTDAGVEGDTLRVGLLLPLTGPGATPDAAEAALAGQQVWWEHVNNDLGGVAGRFRVETVVRDNAYDPGRNQAAFAEIAESVLAITGTVGTPVTASIQELAAGRSMLVGAGSLGSFWASTDNVILTMGANTYFAEIANGMHWAMNLADPPVVTADTSVGLLYQEDDYGRDCLAGYELALQELGFNDVLRQPYQVEDEDLGDEASAFAGAQVEVMVVCTLPSVLGQVLAANATNDYHPVILGSSPSYDPVLPFTIGGAQGEAAGLQPLARYHNLGSIPPYEEESPGMQLLRDNLSRFGADVPESTVTSFFYFGYTQAQTFQLIFEEAHRGGDLTRQGVMGAVDRVGPADLGFGMGEAGFLEGRIPTHVGSVGRPVSTSVARFGMERISDYFVAPLLGG